MRPVCFADPRADRISISQVTRNAGPDVRYRGTLFHDGAVSSSERCDSV